MEKFLKRVKTLAILLIAILISVIAFCGLYVQEYGIWKNILPEFDLGIELNGFRELRYVLDNSEEEKEIYLDENGNYKGDVVTSSEEKTNEVEVETEYKKEKRVVKVNPQENINIENFEKTKKILQTRLEQVSQYEYNIRLDNITGEIIIELPDNENISLEQTLISTIGKITVRDHQTGVILIEDKNIKSATMLASNENNEYQSYLQLSFDEFGKEKLKEISKKYVTVKTGDGSETTSYVDVKLDNQALITTYFAEELADGIIQIPMGESTADYNEYVSNAKNVQEMVKLINGDSLPLKYSLNSDNFVKSTITNQTIVIAKIIVAIVLVLISICMIIKFKFEGFRQAILSVAYIAILSLVFRFTNVTMTLNALVAFISVVAINYVFGFKLLNKLKEKQNRKVALKETIKEIYLSIVPVCIIALIFTFMSSVVINSIGMTLFWGLLVQVLINLVVLL